VRGKRNKSEKEADPAAHWTLRENSVPGSLLPVSTGFVSRSDEISHFGNAGEPIIRF